MTTSATLRRSVTATAWYIGASIVFLIVGALLVWGVAVAAVSLDSRSPWPMFVFGAGVVLTLSGLSLQLVGYYRDGRLDEDERSPLRRRLWSWPPALTASGAVLVGVSAASPLIGIATLATGMCILRWPRGIRLRGVILLTVALVALWIVLPVRIGVGDAGQVEFVAGLFAVGLPSMTALSLWSWDIVTELDRARTTESRLAATQERLRLAAELHDLQGHHLQVIALQLELAERMLARDPDAAADQIRLARASVDAARDGTRELAGRFRGVPLPDELANAADLLRAAGLKVRLDVAREAASAPADLLGPVVRECTTNVLKHGGGRWAELALHNIDATWRLSVANDPGDESRVGAGAGLDGIAHRVGSVGGDVRHERTDDRFAVVVTVPVGTASRGGDR